MLRLVDFSDGNHIALSVSELLSKLRKRPERQQGVTAERWSRPGSLKTKLPRTDEDCGEHNATSKLTRLDQI